MSGQARMGRGGLIVALLLSLLVVAAAAGAALAEELIELNVGQQKTIQAAGVKRIAVGSERVVDVRVMEKEGTVLITALGAGSTNLILWDAENKERTIAIEVMAQNAEKIAAEVKALLSDVEGISIKTLGSRVIIDGDALRDKDLKKISRIAELYPQVTNLVTLSPTVLDTVVQHINQEFANAKLTSIQATRLGNQIVIDGDVRNADDKRRAEVIAQAFGVTIVNFLKVGMTLEKMVVMNVDFIEIDKAATQKLGINWGSSLGVSATGSSENFAAGTLSLSSSYQSTINMLKSTSGARILNRPKLLCRSGEKASFLAGGEIAIPITTASTASVEYKQYGIRLNIEPVVDKENNIATVIEVENSQLLGYTQGKATFGTSKVKTSINVKNGQVIVLSGLVSSQSSMGIDKMPGLGDIPILGALFRSRSFSRNESDLVIFVMPEVIEPDAEKNRTVIQQIKQKYQDSEADARFKFME